MIRNLQATNVQQLPENGAILKPKARTVGSLQENSRLRNTLPPVLLLETATEREGSKTLGHLGCSWELLSRSIYLTQVPAPCLQLFTYQKNLEYEQEQRQTETTQTGQRSVGGTQQRQIIVGMTVMYVCCTTERLMQSECKVACRIMENDTEEGNKPTPLLELAEYSTSYAKTGQTRRTCRSSTSLLQKC